MRSVGFRLPQFHVATVMVLAILGVTVVKVRCIAFSCLILSHSSVRTFIWRMPVRAEGGSVACLIAHVAAATRTVVKGVVLCDVTSAGGTPRESANVVKFAVLATEVDESWNGLNFGWVAGTGWGWGGFCEDHQFVDWPTSVITGQRVHFRPNVVDFSEGHKIQSHRSGK